MQNASKKVALVVALVLAIILPALTLTAQATVKSTHMSMVDWIVNESGHNVSNKLANEIVGNVIKQSHAQNVDPFLLLSLIKNESGFKPNARNKSGASGLMQVIPKWHREKIAGRKILSVSTNIEVGTSVLAEYLDLSRGNIRKALRRYSGDATRYTNKLMATYREIKQHDVRYRFMNELPVTVVSSFHKPNDFSHETTYPVLASL